MRRHAVIGCIALLSVLFLSVSPSSSADLKIICVWANASSGTGTLIKGTDGSACLFDIGGGDTWASYCKAAMDANSITTVKYVIAGHYDSDHVGGLDNLVNRTGGTASTGYSPNVGTVKFYDRGGTTRQDGTAIPSDYLTFVNLSGRRGTITKTTDLALGSATLKILSVGAANTTSTLYVRGKSNVTVSSENDLSITALLTYGGFDMYFGSDAEGTNEKAVDDIIKTTLGRNVDVLHVDHHGSDTYGITSTEFLGIIDPEVAILSVWNNAFGHPRRTTVTNLQSYVEPLAQRIIRLSPGDTDDANFAPENMSYCKTTNGHVTITTNGSTYTVSGSGLTQAGLTNHAVDNTTASPTPTPVPSSGIKVNQVCPFSSVGEYVELYNPGTSAVTLTGYVLDVYSGDYTFTSSDVIPAKGFYVVSDVSPVAGVTPDRVAAINITDNGASSYVQLKNASGTVLDKVGWKTSTVYEGTKLGTLASGKAWKRKTDGADTNVNLTDFSAITPAPR